MIYSHCLTRTHTNTHRTYVQIHRDRAFAIREAPINPTYVQFNSMSARDERRLNEMQEKKSIFRKKSKTKEMK